MTKGQPVGSQRNRRRLHRILPDLTPKQVVALQDSLLANADALLTSALAVLDLGNVALARSLAILGLEESGKAIAVHERRVRIVDEPEGTTFRCDELDALWSSHTKKLEAVHTFLEEERYWFGEGPPDYEANASALGAIKRWASKNNTAKQRGFYVDLDSKGDALSPMDVADIDALRSVIERVHQIGWQLRLGEHIEGKRQDEEEEGVPPATDEELASMSELWAGEEDEELLQAFREGSQGEPLNNAQYRFNPPGEDRSPFRNMGKPGYEAETREVLRLAERLGENPSGDDALGPQ